MFAPVLQCPRREQHVPVGLPTELLELAGGALVAVDHVIDLASGKVPSVEPPERVTHMLEQQAQLLLVIAADRLDGQHGAPRDRPRPSDQA